VTGRLVSRFCNRCGRRFELTGPEPGELGLDRIGTVFRSCVSCTRFVGITCCWDPETRLCVECAARRGTPFAGRLSVGEKRKEAAARRALAQLSSAVLTLDRFGKDPRLRGQLSLPDWEDAWWEASWLLLSAQAYGDQAVEGLHAVRAPTRTRAALVAAFNRLTNTYGEARGALEMRLSATGLPLRREARHPLQPLRGPRLAVVTGLFITALTVTTVLAGASILGTSLRQSPLAETAQPGERAGGVLGTSQAQGTAPAAATPHVPRLVAMLDFDILRIGSLKGASNDLVGVIGRIDVVSFPSPFDRSVRFSGAGPNGFCLANEHLGPGGASVTVDLYAVEPVTSGSLDMVVTAPDGFVTVASIPAKVLRRLSVERWYRVSAEWMPGTREVIQVSERGLGTLFVDSLDLSSAPSSPDPHSFCMRASGMPARLQVLLDSLRVEQ
jgi:hypothetical protein